MDIVIAAEKTSIAELVTRFLRRPVRAEDIEIRENPDETGSFLIACDWEQYALAPNGEIRRCDLALCD